MVFSINPTAEKSQAIFQSKAIQQKGQGAGSAITGNATSSAGATRPPPPVQPPALPPSFPVLPPRLLAVPLKPPLPEVPSRPAQGRSWPVPACAPSPAASEASPLSMLKVLATLAAFPVSRLLDRLPYKPTLIILQARYPRAWLRSFK